MQLASIKALVLDFDGVLTDNRALVHEDGSESVWVNRSDGMGISLLRSRNFPMIVISSEKNPVVKARCDKLNVECVQGVSKKLPVLEQWTDSHGLSLSEVAYVGNDVNDIECMQAVGLGVAPADAHPTVLAITDMTLTHAGGFGAVRELADRLLEQLNGG